MAPVLAEGFTTWLLQLPVTILDKLYLDPWNVQVVFRVLSPLSKHYVLRMLCLESMPLATFETWLLPTAVNDPHENAIEELRKLQILKTSSDDPDTVWLHKSFQVQLKTAVSELCTPWQPVTEVQDGEAKIPTEASLMEMATKKWDAVLHYLVGSNSGLRPSSSMRDLLLKVGLMREETSKNSKKDEISTSKGKGKGGVKLTVTVRRAALDKESSLSSMKSGGRGPRLIITHKNETITSAGYEFLLQETNAQIWRFLKRYFQVLNGRDADMASAISLVFRLGFCELGKGYQTQSLSPTQFSMLSHLSDFGLVHIQDVNVHGEGKYRGKIGLVRCFYPTPFDINDSSITRTTSQTRCHLFVETNFRIYAYTTSDLHVYMLKLFANLLYRLPNMVLAVINRKSATNGISAKQICQFLSQSAHYRMRESVSDSEDVDPNGLPENVVDQLHLWERERQRVKSYRAMYINNFKNSTECQQVVHWARSNDCLLWANKKSLVVRATHSNACHKFISSLR